MANADAASASAEQLAQLVKFLKAFTAATLSTGWQATNVIVTHPTEGGGEIVVGVRWDEGRTTYVAEIR